MFKVLNSCCNKAENTYPVGGEIGGGILLFLHKLAFREVEGGVIDNCLHEKVPEELGWQQCGTQILD